MTATGWAVLSVGLGLVAVSLTVLALRRCASLRQEVMQLKRDQYYSENRLKRVPEEIREAVEPLRVQVARLASGARVAPELIRDGRLYHEITADEAQAALERATGDSEQVMVVDVRTPREYAVRRVPGAKLVPFDELEARYRAEIPEHADKVFVYCLGGERSRSACDFLSRRGYTNLYHVKDGLNGWRGKFEGEGELKMVHFEPSGGPRAS